MWSASFHTPLDIAVVQLVPHNKLPSNFAHVSAKLDVSLPSVGQRVQAFGFPQSSVVHDEHLGWLLNAQPQGAVGEITQVFEHRRDSASMPFPSLEMNIQIFGGMSGGPVFHENGLLCGIVCSSFDFLNAEADVSYASMISPALGLRVRAASDLGVWNGADATLAQLAEVGDIAVANLGAVSDG